MQPPLFTLDFETTGLSPDCEEVIEVGLAGHRPFRALLSDAKPSSPRAQAIHGILPEELRRQGIPGVRALDGLLVALGEGPVRIVCHNAAFEKGFLEAWAAREGRRLPEIQWTCTLEAAHRLCLDPSIHKGLISLARQLGLQHGGLHRAPEDAALTLRIHERLEAWSWIQESLRGQAPLIYLAGPLRGDGSREWIRHNQEQMLLQARWAQALLPQATLLVPHTNFAFLDESGDRGEVRALALRSCEKVLSRCDLMILCGLELSQGMAREAELAHRLHIPIHQVPGWDGFQRQVEGVA